MQTLLGWLSKYKNGALLAAFALIVLPPIGLYYTAQSRSGSLALLALIVLGNLLAVIIR